MQLPIICSRIEGNIDIIEHEKTGLIFQPENTNQMEQLINYALNNNNKMQAMSKTLKDIIDKKFQKENMWQLLLQQYKTLTTDKG